MQTIELGRTGEQVSQLSLGCMLMGTATDEPTSFALLDRFLDAGGTFLDTANCYAWWLDRGSPGGHSESVLGRWFARTGKRDRVFLATKGSALVPDLDAVWGEQDEPHWDRRGYDGAGGDNLRRSIDDSLRRLGTDHVDLYYVHVDDRSTPLPETLAALAEIVRAGKARYIGWSNVRAWRLAEIRQLCDRHGWPAPVAVQQQHSYLRRPAGLDEPAIVDYDLLDYLRANDDLTLVGYSPLLKGVYDNPDKRARHRVMELYRGPDADARLATLTARAGELAVTPGQLALAWLLHQRDPARVALLGARTLAQFQAALPALELTLSREQLAELDAAGA